MQQSKVSSQQFAGQTKRRNEGFGKRLVTARFTCRATGTGLPFGSCRCSCRQVSPYTVKTVVSLGVQEELSALGAGDQLRAPATFTSDCRAAGGGPRAGLVDPLMRKVRCPCRRANPLSSSP
jgi:hypothetical protein